MMRFTTFLCFALLFLFFSSQAQILQPAHWTTEISKEHVSIGDEVELIFHAKIDANWYLYANDFDPDCGPLLTTLEFSDTKNFVLVGGLKSINPLPKHDEVFDCDVKIFKKTAEFRQKVKVTGSPLKISGSIQGQVCTEVDGKCVPFEEDFVFDVMLKARSEKQKADEKPEVENEKQKVDSENLNQAPEKKAVSPRKSRKR